MEMNKLAILSLLMDSILKDLNTKFNAMKIFLPQRLDLFSLQQPPLLKMFAPLLFLD